MRRLDLDILCCNGSSNDATWHAGALSFEKFNGVFKNLDFASSVLAIDLQQANAPQVS